MRVVSRLATHVLLRLHFTACQVDPYFNDLLLLLLLLLLSYMCMCALALEYVPVSVGAAESRRGHQIPWSWS